MRADPTCVMTHELIIQYSVKDVDYINGTRS